MLNNFKVKLPYELLNETDRLNVYSSHAEKKSRYLNKDEGCPFLQLKVNVAAYTKKRLTR